MLKKSLMIGAVAILALVAFSAVMISDDSEARVVGNSISIEVMKEDGTGSGQYLKYDLVADTSDYYIDTGAHEEVYLAFLSNSNQSFDVTQVNDEGILKIPSEVKYGGDTYKVVGIRNNAFKANENGATPETSPLKNITKVVFPETMVVIGVYVSGSDYLPDDRDFSSSPGGYCFSKCLGLKEVVFPEGSKLKFISVGAFQNTPLESLDLSNCKEGVAVRQRTISDDGTITGYEMSLKSVDLSTVTSLESRAFRNCSTIENIVMPADLGATIADDAFPNMTFCDENGDPITSGAELAGKAFKKNSDGKMVPGHVATFITNGGSEPVEKVYFATNDLPGKDIVKRDGVTFYQWRDASNNPYTEMPDEDITLYAYYYMDVPPIADSITYDGNSHTPYNDTDKYTVSGQITGTNAGDYSVTFAPNDPYTVWKDGSEYKESYDRTWSINKETLNITINANKTYNGSALEYNIQTGDASGLVYGDSITAGALITVSANVKNYTVQTTDWIFTAELATAKGASNYNVTYTVSLEINKADSHIDVTGSQTFTYDGSAPDIATENKTGDGAVTFQYYADDTTPTPLADAPVNAGTYYVVAIVAETENYNSYTSARVPYTINKAKITVSGITAENRAYNGDVNATLISTSANLTGKIDGDDLSVTATGVFADKNVADGKTVTITGLTLDGADKGNYILAASGQQETTTANITPAEITVSGITAQNRDYNGDVNATLISTGANLTGKIDGDDLTVTAIGVFADKNVADGKTVTITGLTLDGTDKGNYKLAASGQQTETTANITPVEITVSGITAQNRDYNGNIEATLIFTTATLTGMIAGDDLTVTAAGAFADKNVADGKTVTITGLTLDGTDKGNYKLAASGQQTETTANITPVEITVSGITAQNRAYNRDVDAALIFTTATLTGMIAGDDLTVTATGAFADKNVADGKTVTISGLALTGNDAGNYILAASGQQTETTADITPAEITVSGITAENKTYNGNTEAVLNYGSATLNGVLPGDEVTFVSATGVFADKNVGDGKSVTIGDYVLDGADKGNYVLTSQSMTATADITPATITVLDGITSENKIYNGNTEATLIFTGANLSGKIDGDDLSVTATGAFADKNVADGKTVSITGLTLEGGDAGNYVLAATGNQTETTADITPAEITVSGITAENRAYNRDVDATLIFTTATLTGKIDGDDLSVTATGAFADKNVANGKTVMISGLALTGAAKGNYVLASTGNQTETTADITPVEITVSGITAENRAYNRDVDATLIFTTATLTGKIDGDDLSVTATGAFADKNVADGKTVTISGLALTGNDAGNYVLAASGQQETTTANITPVEITVSDITAESRAYNRDVDATLIFTTATLSGKIDGDDLTVTATGTFSDKKVADGKTVTISGLALDGADKGNYVLATSGQQTETTADITPVTITVLDGITAENKIYNGNTEATLIFTGANLSGKIDGDDLSVTATGTFSDKKVADGKTVTISGLALTGDDAGNYVLASTGNQTETTADITPAEITVSGITAQNRAYNRDVDATLIFTTATLTGMIAGDDLTVTATGAFADKNVADGKTVSITGLTLEGGDAGNYVLAASGQQETTTANITPVEITVSGITAENKTYNGNTEAVLNYGSATLNGVLPGDEVTFVSATGVFADKNVGDGKSVTIGDYVLDGADKGNYVLTSQSMTATADITPATITVSGITASDKVFDGNASATLDKSGMVLDGKIGDDDIVIGASGEFVDKNAENGKTVYIALRLEGADAGNYVLASDTATATASITPAAITGDIEQEGSLIYDGTAQVADVYSTLKSVADEPITVKYSTSRTGEYSSEVPAFTSVGKYTVYYTAEAPNHEVKTGSFTVTISESHNPDIEGGDRVLLSVIAGIAVIAAAMLVGPFLSGRH